MVTSFVVVVACILTCIAFFAPAWTWLLGNDIANLALAISLTSMLLATGIVAEFIFIEGANGNAHHFLAVRENDALFADYITQIFLDRLADLLLVALLVDLPFTVQ